MQGVSVGLKGGRGVTRLEPLGQGVGSDLRECGGGRGGSPVGRGPGLCLGPELGEARLGSLSMPMCRLGLASRGGREHLGCPRDGDCAGAEVDPE